MSFLDHIRSEEEVWTHEVFGGFDPDLHTAGLATVAMSISNHHHRILTRVDTWTIRCKGHKGQKGIEAANAMIQAMHDHNHEHKKAFLATRAVVEGQQAYPPKDLYGNETIARTVATANDLLMLGLVSGAAATLFLEAGRCCELRVSLPFEWKGNRKKTAMHDAMMNVCSFFPETSLHAEGRHVPFSKFKPCEHTRDALCMALRAAGYSV